MKHFRLYLLIVAAFLLITRSISAQHIPVIKLTALEKRIKNDSDTTYIVNFWATWCKPCVAELPEFDSINRTYKGKKVKVLLVTMDFDDKVAKVDSFLVARKITSEVLLLNETNGNYFIPRISEKWSGALPATLIINNKKKIEHFFEKKLNYEFLKCEIESAEKN